MHRYLPVAAITMLGVATALFNGLHPSPEGGGWPPEAAGWGVICAAQPAPGLASLGHPAPSGEGLS